MICGHVPMILSYLRNEVPGYTSILVERIDICENAGRFSAKWAGMMRIMKFI